MESRNESVSFGWKENRKQASWYSYENRTARLSSRYLRKMKRQPVARLRGRLLKMRKRVREQRGGTVGGAKLKTLTWRT
jgi:hypothetical protein